MVRRIQREGVSGPLEEAALLLSTNARILSWFDPWLKREPDPER